MDFACDIEDLTQKNMDIVTISMGIVSIDLNFVAIYKGIVSIDLDFVTINRGLIPR